MTLAEIQGGVVARLGPRSAIPIAGVNIEIHNAADDIRARARNLGVETLDRVAYINAVAGLDVYDWPDEADEIRDVFFLNFGETPIPMTAITFREQPIVDWVGLAGTVMPFTYVQLPGRRIRVMNKPLQSTEDAFMVRFFPGPKRMVKPTDEPNLPRQVHENLIPQAVMRMASYEGIGLAHSASFDIYRRQMEERLINFLQPQSLDGTDHIVDVDAYYQGGA